MRYGGKKIIRRVPVQPDGEVWLRELDVRLRLKAHE